MNKPTVSGVYLDVCCLNRPFDDQRQEPIRLASEAIKLILERIQTGQCAWIGSEALELEIGRTADPERMRNVRLVTEFVERSVSLGEAEERRAAQLCALGFAGMDGLHLACAESGRAGVFLTTADRLLRLALGCMSELKLRVENPLSWLREVIQ
jgi:hypothetical protein